MGPARPAILEACQIQIDARQFERRFRPGTLLGKVDDFRGTLRSLLIPLGNGRVLLQRIAKIMLRPPPSPFWTSH